MKTRLIAAACAACVHIGSSACDLPVKQWEAAYSEADVVAVGVVEMQPTALRPDSERKKLRATVVVETAYKGAQAGETLRVVSEASTCGVELKGGQRWLLLGKGRPLETDTSYGSMMLADENKVVNAKNVELMKARLGGGK